MDQKNTSQQRGFEIFSSLRLRQRAAPKKQLKIAISKQFLATLRGNFQVSGRFKQNRNLETSLNIPQLRTIEGEDAIVIRNLQFRVSNPRTDGFYESHPHLILRYFISRNF